jgi:hypothetical protein
MSLKNKNKTDTAEIIDNKNLKINLWTIIATFCQGWYSAQPTLHFISSLFANFLIQKNYKNENKILKIEVTPQLMLFVKKRAYLYMYVYKNLIVEFLAHPLQSIILMNWVEI